MGFCYMLLYTILYTLYSHLNHHAVLKCFFFLRQLDIGAVYIHSSLDADAVLSHVFITSQVYLSICFIDIDCG